MSAFLGPIHFWLYNKILLQESVTTAILEQVFLQDRDAESEMLKRFGELPGSKTLEHVIDESNIHGWLQKQVSIAELRFAALVTDILATNRVSLADLESIIYEQGKKQGLVTITDVMSPSVIYKKLSDCLLDGMPCDRINEVVFEEPDTVEWRQSRCIHRQYWETVGGTVDIYYILRNRWIEGFLDHTSFVVSVTEFPVTDTPISEKRYRIERKQS